MHKLVFTIIVFCSLSFAENTEKFVNSSIEKENAELLVTVDKDLQAWVQNKISKYNLPYAAVVVLEPTTGAIKAIASHSKVDVEDYKELSTKSLFPAASLFKIVTAAAAIEVAGLDINQQIRYRGGPYTLNKYNYKPHQRKDSKSIGFSQAMAKSTNPPFARVALKHLSLGDLEQYAMRFGLGSTIPFYSEVDPGEVFLPATEYEVARAAAGFGHVKISPLHAALVMSAVQNDGVIMRPFVRSSQDSIPYQQAIQPETAEKLKVMLTDTTVSGTARRYFRPLHKKYGSDLKIYSKTGTLNGLNPKGTNFWFVGGLEHQDKKLTLAVIVVDDGTARVRAVPLAKQITQFWLSPISALTGFLAERRVPSSLLTPFLKLYVSFFKIDLGRFDVEFSRCKSFQDFFCRELKLEYQKVSEEPVFPVDGEIYQSGVVTSGELLQVKGKLFSLKRLFSGLEGWETYKDARYFTVYLSPGDYHHIHSPVSGKTKKISRIPGTLFSVGRWCTNWISNLYCIQERVIIEIDSGVALVCVGAFNVGSIVPLVSEGEMVKAGDKIASFKLGSTVVVLFNDKISLPNIGRKVLFGQSIN